jgi:hypothetical protein
MTTVSESSLGCWVGTFDGEHSELEGPSKNSQERSAALALLTSTVAGCVAMSGATFVYHAPGALEVSFEEFGLSGVQFGLMFTAHSVPNAMGVTLVAGWAMSKYGLTEVAALCSHFLSLWEALSLPQLAKTDLTHGCSLGV